MVLNYCSFQGKYKLKGKVVPALSNLVFTSLKQLLSNRTGLRITGRHLLEIEVSGDSHSEIHGGALESVRQTCLVSSPLSELWRVLENQQLYRWCLIPKTVALSMNELFPLS